MNLDELTVAELKQVAALTRGVRTTKPRPMLEIKRVILVVDRGWIFAGDQSLSLDGYIRLANAVHVFRWESMGFAKMVENWRDTKVDLRKIADVEVPRDSVIFRVPVPPEWGLK